MTLHISALTPPGTAFQVSDRLASRGGRPWDPTWNKTIVLRTMDALVAIGLVGPAYVGDRPIDEWLVEILFEGEVERGSIAAMRVGKNSHNPSRLSASLAKADTAYTAAVAAGKLSLADSPGANVIGWRAWSAGVQPCVFSLEWDDGRALFRRRSRTRRSRAGVGIYPGRWVSGKRRGRLLAEVMAADSDAEREDAMIRVLRECADAGLPIGPDAMCVRISRTRAVPHIRFAPVTLPQGRFFDEGTEGVYDAPAIYTPAIVTPTCAQLPLVATGPPFEDLGGFRIEWQLPRLPPPWVGNDGSLVWRIEGQPRPDHRS